MKAAIFGLAHMHISSLYKSLAAYDDVEFIGWSETPPADQQDIAKKGAFLPETVKYYENWLELAELRPELALVCCDNAASREIACALLSRGIAVVLEKPMAQNYADARAIADCAKEHGAKLAVNWPVAWFTAFNRAKELCDEGRIGKIMRVVYRSPATWGPFSYSRDGQLPPREVLDGTWWYHADRGGGSVLDYACYGAALSTWFFGKRAKAVRAITKNFCAEGFDIEDYSAMLLDFGDGVGLLEGSWSTFNGGEIPSGPVIYGTEGTIVCDRRSNDVKIYIGRSHGNPGPTEIIALPAELPGLSFGEVIRAYMKGEAPLHPLLEPELNVDVMFALDAGRADAMR